MPFTLSHAVIAPPLAKLLRLPLAPLVIGCMNPDLVRMFTDEPKISYLAHTWQGIMYPTLPVGILFCLAWYLLYRPVIYHFLKLNHQLKFSQSQDILKFSILSIIALAIGIATHLIWDGLTHLDFRTFAFHHTLAQVIEFGSFKYPLHFILQIGCSILALPFLFYFCWVYYHQYKITYTYTFLDYIYIVLLIIIPNGLGFIAFYQYFLDYHLKLQPYEFIGRGINTFSTMALLTYSLLSILFLFIKKLKQSH